MESCMESYGKLHIAQFRKDQKNYHIYKTKPNSGHESEGMSQFVEEAPVLLSLQIQHYWYIHDIEPCNCPYTSGTSADVGSNVVGPGGHSIKGNMSDTEVLHISLI